MAMWLCAGLCVVGGLLALGVRNDILALPVPAEPEPVAEERDCFSCGVTSPPTHLRLSRQPTN
jgi:hypothetical protein